MILDLQVAGADAADAARADVPRWAPAGLVVVLATGSAPDGSAGPFAAAFAGAVADPASGGHAQPDLRLETLVRLAAASSDVTYHLLGGDEPPGLLPNPRYEPRLADLDLRLQDRLWADRDQWAADDTARFAPAIQAFTGRHRALTDLCRWLTDARSADQPAWSPASRVGQDRAAPESAGRAVRRRAAARPYPLTELPEAARRSSGTSTWRSTRAAGPPTRWSPASPRRVGISADSTGELLDRLPRRAAPADRASSTGSTRPPTRPAWCARCSGRWPDHGAGRLRLLLAARPAPRPAAGRRPGRDQPRRLAVRRPGGLRAYARRLLVESHPDGPYRARAGVVGHPGRPRIAAAADTSFLVAGAPGGDGRGRPAARARPTPGNGAPGAGWVRRGRARRIWTSGSAPTRHAGAGTAAAAGVRPGRRPAVGGRLVAAGRRAHARAPAHATRTCGGCARPPGRTWWRSAPAAGRSTGCATARSGGVPARGPRRRRATSWRSPGRSPSTSRRRRTAGGTGRAPTRTPRTHLATHAAPRAQRGRPAHRRDCSCSPRRRRRVLAALPAAESDEARAAADVYLRAVRRLADGARDRARRLPGTGRAVRRRAGAGRRRRGDRRGPAVVAPGGPRGSRRCRTARSPATPAACCPSPSVRSAAASVVGLRRRRPHRPGLGPGHRRSRSAQPLVGHAGGVTCVAVAGPGRPHRRSSPAATTARSGSGTRRPASRSATR